MQVFRRVLIVSFSLIAFQAISQSIDVDTSNDQLEHSILNTLHGSYTNTPEQVEAVNHGNNSGITDSSTPDESAELITELPDLQRLVEKVEYRLNSNEDAHLYLDDSLTAIENELKKLTQLVNERILTNLNALKIKVDELDSNLLQKAELSESVPNSISNEPPFRLISIDQWEMQWSAVLTMEGHVTMIYPNETRAGWTLLTVNPLARSATFLKRSTGIETTLFVDE